MSEALRLADKLDFMLGPVSGPLYTAPPPRNLSKRDGSPLKN